FYSTGAAFVALGMSRQPDGDFAATLPGTVLVDGATVRYYLRLVPRRGVAAQTLPVGAPDSTLEFRVGVDREPPRGVHAPLSEVPAVAWPAAIHARIEDNLGIAAAYVETWQDGTPGATLGMVRDPADPASFTTRFVAIGATGSVVGYRIVAVDASRAG